jgi:hypothetical protein
MRDSPLPAPAALPTTTPPHVVLVSAGPATVLVTSDTPAVTDWITQYFGCWWTVRPTTSAADTSGPVLHCHVDPDRFATAQDSLNTRPHRIIEFARNPLHVADNTDDTVCAVDPAEQVAYETDTGRTRLTLTATRSLGLCLAAARITRELIRAQLEADGWAIMHASAAVRDNSATLALGPKGASKTTTALLLTTQGHQLLANDRVFLHPATRALLPWPATATALIFPRLDASSRTVTTSDFFDPGHDDRYPDFLRLTRITPDHRHQIWARTRDALATVPHYSIVLTHDTTRSRELLATQAMVGKVGLETS